MPRVNRADFVRTCVERVKEQIILNARQAEQRIYSIADQPVNYGLSGGHGLSRLSVCHS